MRKYKRLLIGALGLAAVVMGGVFIYTTLSKGSEGNKVNA